LDQATQQAYPRQLGAPQPIPESTIAARNPRAVLIVAADEFPM
jgi:hypothetical protein